MKIFRNVCLAATPVVMSATQTSAKTSAQENYDSWPLLRSVFASTGGGIAIKGYDPIIVGNKCLTTFMAATSDAVPQVYPNFAEFDAVPAQGEMPCIDGKWKAMEGGATGTTPCRFFVKNGVFRSQP